MAIQRDEPLMGVDPAAGPDRACCVSYQAGDFSVKFWKDESFDYYLNECQHVNGGLWMDFMGEAVLAVLKSSREYDEPYNAFQRLKSKWFPVWLLWLWPVKTRRMIEHSFEVKPQ